MLIVLARTVVLYLVVIVVMRVMGKRQIGQLEPSELVVAILIADLAAVPMQDKNIPLVNGVIPIVMLMVGEVTLAFLSMKSEMIRSLVSGRPSLLIEGGKICWTELQRSRININDLLQHLRVKGYPNISDVEYAILETGGQLSVIPKSQKRPVCPEDMGIATKYEGIPTTLIVDGKVLEQNLRQVGLDIAWLTGQLSAFGIGDPSEVLFATLDTQGKLYYQKRSGRRTP